MALCGSDWLYVALCGLTWLYVALRGSIRLTHSPTALELVKHGGSPWLCPALPPAIDGSVAQGCVMVTSDIEPETVKHTLVI